LPSDAICRFHDASTTLLGAGGNALHVAPSALRLSLERINAWLLERLN
jgi:hypothetical protein